MFSRDSTVIMCTAVTGKPQSAASVHAQFAAACLATSGSSTYLKRSLTARAAESFLATVTVLVDGQVYVFDKLYVDEDTGGLLGIEGIVGRYVCADDYFARIAVKLSRSTNPQCAAALAACTTVVPCVPLLNGAIQIMACARRDGFTLHADFARLFRQRKYTSCVRGFAQVGLFLSDACAQLLAAGVAPCDVKPANVLVEYSSLHICKLRLWLGDLDGMTTAATRKKHISITYFMSTPSVFDSDYDPSTCLFSMCLTMLEYTNNFCATKDILQLTSTDWCTLPASHPFSDTHPLMLKLAGTAPSQFVERLRVPFVVALQKLAAASSTAPPRAEFIAGLLQNMKVSFAAEMNDLLVDCK